MDISNPLRAVTPGVEADVLAVLLRSHVALTGARVATMAERGETQVREVLRRLGHQGLVEIERHGQSYTYLLNRDHVLVPGLELLGRAVTAVEERIIGLVGQWSIQPASLILFGSTARRDGNVESDVDLLLVRPDATDADHPSWATQRHELATRVERWVGNRAQVIELSAHELTKAIRQKQPLINELRTDGKVLAGSPLKL